jgi:ribulose-phosphate 3-epimerase
MSLHASVDAGEKAGRVQLFASLTSLSPLALGADARRLVAAGVDGLHIDIADGHFAPFLLFPPAVAWSLRDELGVHVEAHLMVSDPETYLRALAERGVRRIAFHVESTRHPWRLASIGRSLGVEVGVAFNASTSLEVLASLGDAVDYANLLGADHDFAGDRLLPATAARVRSGRGFAAPGVRLQVDGAVDAENAARLVVAGADDLVVGRAVCDAADWSSAVEGIRAETRVDPRADSRDG